MTVDQIITLVIFISVIFTLARTKLNHDLVMFYAMISLVVFQVLEAGEALAGFSNEVVISLALLYVVASALRDTGIINWLGHILLSGVTSYKIALFRLLFPAALFSAFLNNTPVVSVLMPVAQEYSVRAQISASKLLLPLSYVTILAGMTTLLGSSTNLIMASLYFQEFGEALSIFSVAPVGLVIFSVGFFVVIFFGDKLLKARKDTRTTFGNVREYSFRMKVEENSIISNKTIEKAGLRHLKYCYLYEIQRGDNVHPAIGPNEVLLSRDILLFTGSSGAASELRGILGLVPDENQVEKLESKHKNRELVEAVLSFNFSGLNKTVKDIKFRKKYGSVVLAISRNGDRVNEKPGQVVLSPGDVLLLEGPPGFSDSIVDDVDFLSVKKIGSMNTILYRKAGLALSIFIFMVLSIASQFASILISAAVAVLMLIFTGCISVNKLKTSPNWSVLITIASSFALGAALRVSGLDQLIATFITNFSSDEKISLLLIFFVAILLSEFISNNASIVILFPICIAIGENLNLNSIPLIMTAFYAASSSFLTPFGYQTNLMVFGPGGYQYKDYLRAGVPLTIASAIITITFVPLIWPFEP